MHVREATGVVLVACALTDMLVVRLPAWLPLVILPTAVAMLASAVMLVVQQPISAALVIVALVAPFPLAILVVAVVLRVQLVVRVSTSMDPVQFDSAEVRAVISLLAQAMRACSSAATLAVHLSSGSLVAQVGRAASLEFGQLQDSVHLVATMEASRCELECYDQKQTAAGNPSRADSPLGAILLRHRDEEFDSV